VGEVYLSFFRADEFIRITKAVHDETISFHDAEYRLLGTSHCEVGYLIGQGWHFAPPINDAILHHHDPDAAPPENAALVAVVAIANQYSTLRRLGYGNPRPAREDLDGSGWWETLRQSLPGTKIDPNRIIMELDGSIAQIRSAIENTYI
jgi:HD-like signal output (HDOD) protein